MKISLVVPVFNEEDSISLFYKTVKEFEPINKYEVEIIFINDGSTDNTQNIAYSLSIADPMVKLITLTRNFGKESALFAGLEYAKGDAIIPMDVDLQDPIEIIPLMIEKWQSGADMVLAKRSERNSDSTFKKKTAEWFYRCHNAISHSKIEENVGDFRLMNRETVENIKKMPEINLFMKGILSWVGGNVEIVEYSRAERRAGSTKFNSWKLWNLALEGITSFSTFPLRIWSYLGLIIALCSFIYGSWMILSKIILGNSVAGYPSIIVSILFLGGVQLIGIGVLGEYIGRIYLEAKRRPRYLVNKKMSSQEHKNKE
ncbi:glycosyltransferase family 2 protein [Erwinia billingiae]|uniref:glycosyltransferase family 2 protein n=1 Tax=Erwinia billingiae TaxID=182337 RepID=UPI002247C769|nr:glycosyltransferase family 2 protein [Erwinia billingiae]MCX0500923.1 glycosyltransferase [Erwinia billingiae]